MPGQRLSVSVASSTFRHAVTDFGQRCVKSTVPVAPILVQGWVRTRRDSKDFSFIELNDGSCLRNLQIIAKNTLPNYAAVQRLITGASIIGARRAGRVAGQRTKLGSRRG